MVAQKHTMNMKCVKDSTPKELPKGLDTVYIKTEKVIAQDQYKVDERYTLS